MPLDFTTISSAPASQLGDCELLAAALNRSLTAAAMLLARFGGVAGVARAPLTDLRQARVPERRARQLLAAIEIGRRSLARPLPRGELLESPDHAERLMWARLANRPQEELHVLGLDVKNRVLTQFVAAIGNVAEVNVDPRDVFRPLLHENAASAIVVHNHPSGCPDPSDSDRELTRQLVAAGTILGIKLIDHIIVARLGAFSFAAHGEIF